MDRQPWLINYEEIMNLYSFKLLIFFLHFVRINEIICKKISLPDIDLHSGSSIGECQQCKILTDSFNHWLEKTSRGKYEGGDAAWEEAKLKSYSRSEMRLVEVQEGLCSEVKKHKDYCYALAEEAEEPLEKWWFHEDPASVDLYTWLCIETLQYCCPENHYGETCAPCPLYKNQVCGGHGHCAGESTRKGNGTCICHKGFAGTNCEDCAKNYFRVNEQSCERCHKACEGCSGEGPAACNSCRQGWELHSGACVDVDECLITTTCKSNQYCVNRAGSYSCKNCHQTCNSCVDAGPSNCTACDPSHVLWSGMCIDDHMKSDLLQNALKRLSLYCGLLIITYFTFRKSKFLAALVVLIVAVYIYYSESLSKMNVVDLFLNMYFINSSFSL